MKKTLSVLMLIGLAATSMAQQTPATPPKTTAPAARTLTPAQQKQKDKIDREVQRDRQIRAEWAQKQREYEAKQADKERQRQAKKNPKEQDRPVQTAPAQKPVPAPPVSAPVTAPAPTPPPAATAPTIAEPTRKEKREKRRQEKAVEPSPPPVVVPDAPAPVLTETAPAPEPPKPERVKREKRIRPQRVDSVSTVMAGSEPATSQPRREFLPKGHLFEPILLDPLEAQTYGALLPMYTTEGKRYRGSIVPFAFGFAKPFYRRTTEPGRSEEWVLDLASFTQFEAYRDPKLDKARRQIVNNDYKVSILYNVRRGGQHVPVSGLSPIVAPCRRLHLPQQNYGSYAQFGEL